jgi:hypothetical protein
VGEVIVLELAEFLDSHFMVVRVENAVLMTRVSGHD